MQRLVGASIATLITLSISLPAFGWGQIGHRITGAIAQHYLNPAAQSQLATILPNESLAEAATYADEMRSNPDPFWQDQAGPYHYVTVPGHTHYDGSDAPEQGDAYTALNQFKATVLDPQASLEQKQLALRFIIHIIGDLHQPLHAGNGEDRGGNSVKVRFFWEDSNLHRVWDSGLIQQRELSYTEWADLLHSKITPAQIVSWHSAEPLDWIAESVAIRDGIYPQDANKMAWDYLYQHLPTATQRLQQGGVRIALYLNELFNQSVETSK